MIELLKAHSFFADKAIESCTLLENQGYCNENYIVSTKKDRYLVRKFGQEGIDRKQEFYFQKIASAQDIAPEPLLLDEENALMIMMYQEGVHKQILSSDERERLIVSLKKFHAHDIDNDDKIVTALCRYEFIKNPSDNVIEALDTIDCYCIDYVLCHNDLNPKNILWYQNKVILLDFEYAALNDCYFDLASISVEFQLSEEDDMEMLNTYFGSEFFDESKLNAYKVVYKALCEEWFKEYT